MRQMGVLGMMCMRRGSKRLKDKNILPYLNIPMFRWGLKALVFSDDITAVALVTDYSKEELEWGSYEYDEGLYFIPRPKEISGDGVKLQTTIKWAYGMMDSTYDVICHVMATNPLIQTYDISAALYKIRKGNCDIVRSYGTDGLENGLIAFKTLLYPPYDAYTGSIEADGIEIHNESDYDDLNFRGIV